MEPNVDRGMWSVVMLLAAIVIGGVVLLAFPRISGKIFNSMDDTVNKAFNGETPEWVSGSSSSEVSIDALLYKEYDDYVEIIGFDKDSPSYSEKDKKLVIPNTINDKPVTIIGNSAFSKEVNITELVIGDNVEHIGVSAFEQVPLTKVKWGDPRVISDYAFYGHKVKEIDFGNKIDVLGKKSLYSADLEIVYFISGVDYVFSSPNGDNTFHENTVVWQR